MYLDTREGGLGIGQWTAVPGWLPYVVYECARLDFAHRERRPYEVLRAHGRVQQVELQEVGPARVVLTRRVERVSNALAAVVCFHLPASLTFVKSRRVRHMQR